jgi:hypothetical protein
MMDDATLERGLRARPPADPVYRSRLEARAADVTAPRQRPTVRVLPALGLLLSTLLLVSVVLVVGSGVLRSTPGPFPPAGVFTPAGRMTEPRGSGFTATPLADGRVLVVGGEYTAAYSLDTAELWDRATQSFESVGSMAVGRSGHTATLLHDGRVLIAGGSDAQDTAQIWDQATGTFGPLIALASGRLGSAATLLHDGRVLIAGGESQEATPLPLAEVWDPTSGASTSIGSPETPRFGQTATTLRDGRVLVVGGAVVNGDGNQGDVLADAELWDPTTGSFTPTGSMAHHRVGHSATLLPDGRVLVVGGYLDYDPERPGMAEVWDPATGMFSELPTPVPDGTLGPLRADGRMLVIRAAVTSSCEAGEVLTTAADTWDPLTGVIGPAGSLSEARTGPVMALLPDGRVLVLGGQGPQPPHQRQGPGCIWLDKGVISAEAWSP